MILATFSAADLLGRDLPPARYLAPEVVPSGLILLAGKPKLGKSWLALGLSLAVAGGTDFLGRPIRDPGDALYLGLEDGERRLQDRLKRMLGGRNAPARLHLATSCPNLDEGGADALHEWIEKTADPRLVVVDVFARIRSRQNSGRAYADDYQAVLPLKILADASGVTILVVTHTRKAEASDDPFDAISATTGLVGAADHALILDRNGSGVHLYGRGRDAGEIDLALKFDPTRGRWDALGDAGEINRSDARNAILGALRRSSRPLTPREVADLADVSHEVAKKRLPAMVKDGEAIRVGAGTYSAPDPAPPIPGVPVVPG